MIHDVEEKEIQMSEPSPRSTREWGDAERAMLGASCGRSSECDLVVIQWIALECFFKTCASSSSLLSSPLFLVSSLISSSIPYHGHSGNVLDDNDEMNALTGAVADKLMKT